MLRYATMKLLACSSLSFTACVLLCHASFQAGLKKFKQKLMKTHEIFIVYNKFTENQTLWFVAVSP
jgi:hypothetical protein